MQISTIKNQNFEKPFRNPSYRTQVNILKKIFFGYLSNKIWFRVCSVTAKMFELRNSGENRRKRSKIFFENLPREYKDLILVKKKFKIISCLCTFKMTTVGYGVYIVNCQRLKSCNKNMYSSLAFCYGLNWLRPLHSLLSFMYVGKASTSLTKGRKT